MAGGKDSNVSGDSGTQKKEIPWDRLPLNTLEHIFSFLSPEDRSKASTVCRNWSEIYDSPSVWRETTVIFRRCNRCKSGLEKRKLVYKYGAFFRRLTILYSRRHCNSLKFISCKISEFLLAMLEKGVQLKSLRMPRIMVAAVRREYVAFQYCEQLENFLVTQKELNYVDFTNARALTVTGIHVLETLVPEAIEHLRLENFFASLVYPVYNNNRYLAAIGRFKNLKSLSINYDYLSNDVVALLSAELTGKLENLFILCQICRAVRNIITDESWINFGKTCKNLEVKFRLELEDLPTEHILNCGIISPFIPLREIEFQLKNIWNQHDNAIFIFLVENFSTALRSVQLELKGVGENGMSNALRELLYRCTNLKKLSISARFLTYDIEQLVRNVLDAIMESSLERPVTMTEFRATFKGLGPIPHSTFKSLRNSYLEQFKRLGVLFKIKSKK